MKYIDPRTGERKSISVKASDTLPIGSIVEFNGNIIPEGWEEVRDPEYLVDIDLDTFVGATRVCYAHRATNRPGSGENGNVIFLPHSAYPDTYGVQIYITRPSGLIYIRNLEDGVWGEWEGFIKGTDSGWENITLLNGFTNLSSVYPTLKYRKIGDVVYVLGMAKPPEAATSKPIGKLPEGARPSKTIYDIYVTDDTAKVVFIEPNGNITFVGCGPNWVSINISFVLE